MLRIDLSKLNYVAVARWLAVGWSIVMLIGCLTPHEELPDTLTIWNDKLQHVAIFALFSFLWKEAGFRVGTVIVAGLLFGALIEVLQYVLPINRSADWDDLAADFGGTILGVIAALIWARLYPNRF
ncbi:MULTISPECIES: VanZ family protein [Spirosoma]|uniref:VanZ family protein n=1 Tax=Spirosoma liriopis TaxID=2937440 RepID=A0ABT0HK13_9BACT|nr:MULTISPECIES: VanZ family protein [Spirosoma]MCK8492511.1 VanZ family protein [Spirosoma liriopis]UHG91982.1 VanZ family protein [Spirosoma oryzicola]